MMLFPSAAWVIALCLAAQVGSPPSRDSEVPPVPDLVLIPGGEFTMGGIGP